MNRLKRLYGKYPLIGLRTVKTVLAVMIVSLFMHYVLHQNPFFACIGAVVAMERSIATSIKAAVIRNVGTIVGGVVGIIIGSFTENYLLMAFGLIPVICLNNLLGKKESIVPGAIVYFAVFLLNTKEQAWVYGLTRIAGTLIGTLIALAINALLFPPEGRTAETGEG